MSYHSTQHFRNLISRINFDISLLETEIQQLSSITKKSEDERKKITNARSRLKTKMSHRLNLYALNIPTWSLFLILVDQDNTKWNDHQLSLWNKTILSYEGKGEASLRDFFNLPSVQPTFDSVDIPELMYEAKCVQSATSPKSLQSIQPGKTGRHTYCRWVLDTAEQGLFKNLDKQVRGAIGIGEINKSILLTQEVRTSLFDAIKPSKIFTIPEAICLTTEYGFLLVKKEDYDDAFEATCVTKCSPKYAIKKSYLRNRILRSTDYVFDENSEQSL